MPVEPARATKLIIEIMEFSQFSFAKKNRAGAATNGAFFELGEKKAE